MECPMCGSDNVLFWDYDNDFDPLTGYQDRGVRYRCLECSAEGEYDE